MITQTITLILICLLFLLWLIFRERIRYWGELLYERGWYSTVHYDRCLTVYKHLFSDINAFAVSLKERREKDLMGDTTYTYGEIMFYSFVRILEKAQPKPGEIFYDLGSGSGKAVFIAALVFDFAKVYGIEKLDGLFELSQQQLEKLENQPERKKLLPNKAINVQFIHHDFLTYDFSDGDVVFINATCFRGEMFNQIIAKLLKLKVGSRVILGSASLENVGGFELQYQNLHLMGWGLNMVRIYQRV
jgi:precorrin-6B methylase 2